MFKRLFNGSNLSISSISIFGSASNQNQTSEYTDVLIIGGGIVGSSAAYCLTQTSMFKDNRIKVTLIERYHIGSGASSLSAGTIYCAGYGNYSSILSTFCMDTMEIMKSINNKGYDIELEQNGALKIATTSKQVSDIYQSYLSQKQNGYDLEWIDSTTTTPTVHEIEPNLSFKVIACIHSPQSGHVNPGKATVVITEEAKKNGAQIYENMNVINIKPLQIKDIKNSEYRYIITTECGRIFYCKNVIIANGAWCRELCAKKDGLNIDIPVVAVKGQIWTTKPIDFDTLNKVIFITESSSYWKDNSSRNDIVGIPEYCTHDENGNILCRHAYGRQCVDGCILFGGSRIKCDIDDFSILKDDIDRNIKHVEEDILPIIRDVEISGYWCGLMPFSMDGKPIIGELNEIGLDGVWLLYGFGPHGIQARIN